MKQKITLGIVCLARKTFDFNAAAEIFERIRRDLAGLPEVDLVIVPGLVFEVEDARKAARIFASRAIDALVCISGTFHLGHLLLEIQNETRVPVLLWGLNELPYDGGKIRLNSVCGVNLDASNLYKAGIRDYHAVTGDAIDTDWVDAVRVIVALKRARVGIAGSHAHGFFNMSVDEPLAHRQMGVIIDHFELREIFDFPAADSDVAARRKSLADVFDLSAITESQADLVARLSVKLAGFQDRHGLDALALRCWPEFAADFGIAPCAAMSLLQGEHRILACEGDIDGALSMLAQRAAGAGTPFLFDFSQVNFEENFALFWHCGVAPCGLWDSECVRSLDPYFATGKGVTADFVLKSGDLSILRLDSADREYRTLLMRAKAVPMKKELKGTYLKAVFDEPVCDVLGKVIYNGIAHHASVVYGEFIRPFEIVSRIKGWRVIS
ncbi:MAG: fucose isomerase [Spirochaetes bacterium]|nr:MAG: fucose isomerase [Spirochaetota bacterium]